MEGGGLGGRSTNRLALFLLFLCFAINQLDRTIISFVAVPLKVDLDLSDSEFAIITGPVFSVTYGLFTLFFAYFADRRDRAKLLFLVLTVWSVASAACGLATSFFQLLVLRLMVGIGEAGGSPISMALVTDYAPQDRRASAYAVLVLGSPLGVFVAAVAGSHLSAQYGWRTTFFLCGGIGLVLAWLMKMKLRDPRPASAVAPVTGSGSAMSNIVGSVIAALRTMGLYRSTIYILISFSFSFFLGGGLVNWGPIFFNRYHPLSAQEAATYVGLAFCSGIVPGLVVGGIVSDRLAKASPMWAIYISELTLLLSFPAYFCAFFLSNSAAAIVAFGIGIFLSQMSMGPVLAAFNSTLPTEIRSTANAVLLLGGAVISGGIGNLLVGVLSDLFSGQLGLASLRVSLIIVTLLLTVIAIINLFRSQRHYSADLSAFAKQNRRTNNNKILEI